MNHSFNTKSEMRQTRQRRRRSERGYALIAIIGVMMFSLILMTAIAPSAQREAQREKEEEMLWRGQQIALALARYPGATKLRQLIDGVPVGVKKVRLLRPSAICDPMLPCDPSADNGNWRLLRRADPLHKELYDAIDETAREKQVPLDPRQFVQLRNLALQGTSSLPGQQADTKLDGESKPDSETGNDDDKNLDTRPIVGVVSNKTGRMFRSYFGIEEYNHTLFFPSVPVIAGGFLNPLAAGAALNGLAGQNERCPNNGVMINGKCTGAVNILNPRKKP